MTHQSPIDFTSVTFLKFVLSSPSSFTWPKLRVFIVYYFNYSDSFLALLSLLMLRAKWLHLCLTLCDPRLAHQALLSTGFSRQEYWSGLPFPSPGDLPDPGIKSRSLLSPALAGRFFPTSATWEVHSLPLRYTVFQRKV